ncbi:hypothetical protein C8P68_107204 [Mucilaginibacter yixingensis]|uniref:Uncharacterized protein n=1 Tax=Mucilaginibacter yixingensis TaxID=1295612 RepID=A0A2T5J6L2_9SPHI|nr:hypothetical protein [Mucilaginibacter yixingensis]PTQ94139.1 hypothetical protein C8P68_107204 [Mucilaginibacter yixingensis]
MLKRTLFTAMLFFVAAQFCRADSVAVNHFVVKDNPFGNEQIAVVATDSLDNPQSNVSGTFTFTFNGFQQDLVFNQGVAFYSPKLAKSSFLYLRHTNDAGSHGRLYYVYKHDDKLTPIHISWMWLLVIPLTLALLAYLFKRFIIIAIVIFLVFVYFNHYNGLNAGTFFESIIDGLKNLV